MFIEIKNRFSGSVLFSVEIGSLRLAVEAAVKAKADLRGADLRGADLREADLREADLWGANLGEADLGEANLGEANLGGADLWGADLGGANLGEANLGEADLGGANLWGANLRGAKLWGAKLWGANLWGADLRGANLGEANLTSIRDDFWAVLSGAPTEVVGLRQALTEGRIDGSTYHGDCACLVGTLANVRHCDLAALPFVKADSNRLSERWFLQLHPGDTPDNSEAARITLEWLDTWLENMRAAFGQQITT